MQPSNCPQSRRHADDVKNQAIGSPPDEDGKGENVLHLRTVHTALPRSYIAPVGVILTIDLHPLHFER